MLSTKECGFDPYQATSNEVRGNGWVLTGADYPDLLSRYATTFFSVLSSPHWSGVNSTPYS